LPRTTNSLAVLYFAQGTLYLAFLLWRGVFSRIAFFRVPPALVLFYMVYLLLVFVAVLYFLYASYGLFSGNRHLLIGVFFTAIGVMNTASILYIIRNQFRKPSGVSASFLRFLRWVSGCTYCQLGRSQRFPGESRLGRSSIRACPSRRPH